MKTTIFYVVTLILIGWMLVKGFQDITSKEGWHAGTSFYNKVNK